MKKFYKICASCLYVVCLMLLSIAFYGFRPKGQPEQRPAAEFYNVPIIMYHSTHKKNPGKYCVTPALLEEDLKYLNFKGYTSIFIQDLIDFQEKDKCLPDNPIIITFDDGYTNNYLNAFPLFKKYETKCVMSIVGKYIDDNYKDGKLCPTRSHLSYVEIKELYDSGFVEIQNHTYNLHNTKGRIGLGKKKKESIDEYENILTEDLMLLQNNLKEKLNISCTTVAYPFGKYSKETESILKKLGFKAALTCNEGINKITKDSSLFYLKRYNRPNGKSSEKFFRTIEKKLDK